MSIESYAATLKMPYTRTNYSLIVEQANREAMSYEDFLELILKNEVILRSQNGIKTKIRQAKFPKKMLLSDFKRNHLPVEIKQKIRELESLNFIENNENIILIGNPGTGKTALSTALGMQACLANKTVLFISVPNLLIELREAMSLNQINKYKRKFERYDLVILDELGYCTFDQQSGEILFNLLSNRNNNGSIIITSNLVFDRWNEVFKDKILTAAMVDRLAHKAHLIDMSGESYRIRETQDWRSKNQQL